MNAKASDRKILTCTAAWLGCTMIDTSFCQSVGRHKAARLLLHTRNNMRHSILSRTEQVQIPYKVSTVGWQQLHWCEQRFMEHGSPATALLHVGAHVHVYGIITVYVQYT